MIRKRRKKSKNYFTQETEDWIVKYNKEPDSDIRSDIYEKHIHYAFFKLTQNQIKDWNEDDQWVIVQIPPTAEYNPNTFSTIFWINYIEGESRGVYYCTHAFALEFRL